MNSSVIFDCGSVGSTSQYCLHPKPRQKSLGVNTPVQTPSCTRGDGGFRPSHLEQGGILVLSEVLLACMLPGNPEHGLVCIVPAHPWELPTFQLLYYPTPELSGAAWFA